MRTITAFGNVRRGDADRLTVGIFGGGCRKYNVHLPDAFHGLQRDKIGVTPARPQCRKAFRNGLYSWYHLFAFDVWLTTQHGAVQH